MHSCSLPQGSDEYIIEDGFADGNHDRNMGEGEGDGENGNDDGSINELDGKNELDSSEDVVEGGTVAGLCHITSWWKKDGETFLLVGSWDLIGVSIAICFPIRDVVLVVIVARGKNAS